MQEIPALCYGGQFLRMQICYQYAEAYQSCLLGGSPTCQITVVDIKVSEQIGCLHAQ